jgi:L-malate glycosyltransferase
MPKVRVFHILEWFEIGGGMEKIAAEIACGLDRDKYDVEVWCVHRGGRFVDLVQQKEIPVRVLNIATYHNPLNILRLAKAFRAAKPDIIHTHGYFAATIGRIAARIAGVPICINHVHSAYWEYTSRNLFIERLLSRVTRKVICVSDHVRDFVVNHEKIDPSRVEVIYNGISFPDIPPREPARQAFNVTEGDIIITAVASLFENKGHKVLLKALSLLSDQCKDFKCWIIGEGPMEKELKELTQQLNLGDKVFFWGVREDVGRFLSASDIFVLASIQREGLPVSVLEAWAYQVPVIATRVGGVPEMIEDQVNGLLIAPNDPVTLAVAINGLIVDRPKRLQFAQAGVRKFKERFDVQLMITRIENLYQECLKK